MKWEKMQPLIVIRPKDSTEYIGFSDTLSAREHTKKAPYPYRIGLCVIPVSVADREKKKKKSIQDACRFSIYTRIRSVSDDAVLEHIWKRFDEYVVFYNLLSNPEAAK